MFRFQLYIQMVKMKQIIVTWKNTVCLDMRRNADDSWSTVVQRPFPTQKRNKYKTGAWGRLMRRHKKSLRK